MRGITLNLESAGRGRAVLLLHGLAGIVAPFILHVEASTARGGVGRKRGGVT